MNELKNGEIGLCVFLTAALCTVFTTVALHVAEAQYEKKLERIKQKHETELKIKKLECELKNRREK